MNNPKYDEPKVQEMQAFLEYLYNIALANQDYYISPDVVYNELARYGLGEENINADRSLLYIREYFEEWFYQLNGYNNNLSAYSTQGKYNNWAQFNNGYPDEPFIKLYIPMDSGHIQKGVLQLFAFISSLGIKHTSKVDQELSSDGVIVRVSKNDVGEAIKIIDFVNSDPYIKSGLLKPNPFIPTVAGVGMMVDYGRSFNKIMSENICHYINFQKSKGQRPDIREFYNMYIKNASEKVPGNVTSRMVATDIKDAFEIACGIKPREIEGYIPPAEPLTLDQKRSLFIDAVKGTYNRYGIDQVWAAIREIINHNNYDLIINGSSIINYRETLQKNVSPKDAEIFVRTTMEKLNPDNAKKPIDELILLFINFFFGRDIFLRLYESCALTYEKHGADWLKGAIYTYMKDGDAIGFSRYIDDEDTTVNYRETVIRMGQAEFIVAMKKYLNYMGISTISLNEFELIDAYVEMIERSKYESVENIAKITT